MPFLFDLSTQLKINIICYDYSGFGKSIGKPSENEIKNDIISVIDFANNFLISSNEKIILFGNSLGSVPTLHVPFYYLNKNIFHRIVAIILLSPVGINLPLSPFSDSRETQKNDIVNCINCPVFLIHGKKDNLISHVNSINLGIKIKNKLEWYPKSGDHNIIVKYRAKFYNKLKFFLGSVNTFYTNNMNSTCKEIKLNTSCKNFSIKFEDNFIMNQSTFKNNSGEQIGLVSKNKLIGNKCYNNLTIYRKSTNPTVENTCPFDKKNEDYETKEQLNLETDKIENYEEFVKNLEMKLDNSMENFPLSI